MSNVDMTWAGRITPQVPAQTATWQAPRFNPAGALEAAQSYLARKQQMDLAKEEAPYNLSLMKQRVAAGEHEAGQWGVTDQLNALRLKEAQQGAADDASLHDDRLAATRADLQARIRNGELTNDQIQRTAATADVLRYVFSGQFPDGSPEQGAAWNAGIDGLAGKGFLDAHEADYWKRHGPDRQIARVALTADATIKDALTKSAGGRTPYSQLSTEEKLKVEDMVRKQAVAGLSTYETLKPEDMQKRYDEARANVYSALGITGLPAGAPDAGSIKKDKANYDEETPPVAKTDKGEVAGSTTAEKKAGQKKKATNDANKADAKGEAKAGSERSNAVAFDGDPHNLPAATAWFNSLPDNTWFINPSTGTPRFKPPSGGAAE